jgi:NifU-like protein
MVYPPKVRKCIVSPKFAGQVTDENAKGRAVSLECGTYVEFAFSIEPEAKLIDEVRYQTNGCGFMIAAAEILAGMLSGKLLTELHGLGVAELNTMFLSRIGLLAHERSHCLAAVLDAVKNAFKMLREQQVQEFIGEKALICTCFGISEERIEDVIRKQNARTVERVGELCNAGTGCGACQMMIQDMLELTPMAR